MRPLHPFRVQTLRKPCNQGFRSLRSLNRWLISLHPFGVISGHSVAPRCGASTPGNADQRNSVPCCLIARSAAAQLQLRGTAPRKNPERPSTRHGARAELPRKDTNRGRLVRRPTTTPNPDCACGERAADRSIHLRGCEKSSTSRNDQVSATTGSATARHVQKAWPPETTAYAPPRSAPVFRTFGQAGIKLRCRGREASTTPPGSSLPRPSRS